MEKTKICGTCNLETESQSDFCNNECYTTYYNKVKEWHKSKKNEQ